MNSHQKTEHNVYKSNKLTLDDFLDVWVQVYGERQKYPEVTDQQTGPVECQKDVKFALISINFQQRLHFFWGRNLRSHSVNAWDWMTNWNTNLLQLPLNFQIIYS